MARKAKAVKVESRIAHGETILQVIFTMPEGAMPEPHMTLAFLEAVAEFVRSHPNPVYIGAIRSGHEGDDAEWDVYFHELLVDKVE